MKNKIYWPFIILSYSSLISIAFIDNSRGPVYPNILQEFKITLKYGSLIFSLSTLMGLFTSATSKYWLCFLGTIQSLSLGCLIMFLGSISYWAIPYFNLGFYYLLLSSVFLGCGISLIAIPMNILIAEGSPANLRRNAFAGLHAIYGLGSLLAPLLFSYWTELKYNWNSLFLVLAIIPLFPLFYSCRMISQESIQNKTQTSLKPPLKLKLRILFGLMFGFYVSSEVLISSRLVLYLKQLHQYENQTAQYFLSLFFLFLFLGRLSFIFISERISSFKSMLISLIFSFILTLIGIYLHPIFLCMTGLSMSYFFPVAMEWLNKKCPIGIEYMTGSIFTLISVNLVVLHSFFGQVAELFGLQKAFLMTPVLLVLSLIILIILERIKLKQMD
jgi:MFS transporter, FHS family, glucose/mannose:H+ symporter